MLSRRYRRLLQRRLRRRPLLPFLLAATVAIDGVLPFLDTKNPSSSDSQLLFLGLAIGQLFLLAVWLTSSRSGFLLRLGMASAGVSVVSALLFGADDISWSSRFTFGFFHFSAAVAACSILFLIQNGFRQGIRKSQRGQFSIGWLLMLTTLVAFASYGAVRFDWTIMLVDVVWWMIASEVLGGSVMLLITMLIRSTSMAILAMLIVFAIACAVLIVPLSTEYVLPTFVSINYYAGSAVMIGVWLLGLRARRLPPVPFPLRLFGADEEAAPENPERPLERHQAAELKEINVVV